MGSPSSLRAQARPPNPAPTITTRARVSAIGQDAELGVGEPQGGLDGVGRTGARKHEAEVAIALRQGNEPLAGWNRDHQAVDAGHAFCLVLAFDRAKPPALADRQHHDARSEEHTSELQSRFDLVCRLLLEKKNIAGYVLFHIDKTAYI